MTYLNDYMDNIINRLTSKKTYTYVLLCLFCFVIANSIYTKYVNQKESAVYFLDVGQGDCILIRDQGQTILIDGGGEDTVMERPNTGMNIVKPFLIEHGIGSIDLAIVSHMHEDHGIGIVELIEEGFIKELAISSVYMEEVNEVFEVKSYENPHSLLEVFCQTIFVEKIPLTYLSEGDKIYIQNGSLTCIGPSLVGSYSENENENSLVIYMELLTTSFLFTGDMEEVNEKRILNDYQGLSCDILKVAHHGSNTSSCQAWIEELNADIGVISVGYNLFNHPNSRVLIRLDEANVDTYTTLKYGMIKIAITDKAYEVIPYLNDDT